MPVILRDLLGRALAFVLILAAVVAPAARADGDPASDVLLSQDSFLPYAPPVSANLKTALENVLKEARAKGFPMKVALILTDRDLGAYPQMFNTPQPYADLLTRELSALNPHGDALQSVHLLVVMPGGFGGNNLGDRVDEALGSVTIQGDAQSDGLARAAIEAVARLATVNGHQVAVPPEADVVLKATDKSTKSGGTSPVLFLLPVLAVFGILAVSEGVRRRRSKQSQTDDD